MNILVRLIKVSKNRHRSLDKKKVKAIADSIKEVGLLNPILISGTDLIAGAHRLAAYKLLGLEEIEANDVFYNGNEFQKEMIEIVENLMRSELTGEERILHERRYIQLKKEDRTNEVMARLIKSKQKATKKDREFAERVREEKQIDLIEEMEKVVSDDETCHETPLSRRGKEVLGKAKEIAKKEAIAEVADMTGASESTVRQKHNLLDKVVESGVKEEDAVKLTQAQQKKVVKQVREQGIDAQKAAQDVIDGKKTINEATGTKAKNMVSRAKQRPSELLNPVLVEALDAVLPEGKMNDYIDLVKALAILLKDVSVDEVPFDSEM